MASTDSAVATQRAAASNVAVSLGFATILVDFVPAAVPNKDKASQFHHACGVCTTPTRLRQTVVCPNGVNHVTAETPPRKVMELPDKTLRFVTPEEVAAVQGVDVDEDGPKALRLLPVRSAELMEHTLPGDVVYRLRPNKKTTAAGTYDLLRVLVTQALRAGKVLVGELSIRSAPRLFWLSLRHGQVVAQALMRPDDIAAFDEIPKGDVGEKLPTLAAQLIEQLTVPFDPADFRNRTRERAVELAAVKESDGSVGGATVTPINHKAEVDLEQLLEGMLAS